MSRKIQQVEPIAITSGAAYMISVSVRVGASVLSLDPELFKSKEAQQNLKQNGVKSKELLPIYEVELVENGKTVKFSLAGAGTALSNSIDPIQKNNMICSGSKRWWFYPEVKHQSIMKALKDREEGEFSGDELIKPGRKQLLEKLLLHYEAAKQTFEARLTNILNSVGRMDQFPLYAARFPTREQIENDFRIEIEGPIRVPGVNEIANQSPEFKAWIQQIHEQIQRDLPKVIDDAGQAVAEFLTRLRDIDPARLTKPQVSVITQCHEKLLTLVHLYESMAQGGFHPIAHLMKWALAINPTNCPSKQEIDIQLDKVREHLLTEEWVREPINKGAKQLLQWCGVLSLEERIKQFQQELADFELNKADLSDEEREQQFKALAAKAKSFSGILKTAAQKLIDQVEAPAIEDEQDEQEVAEPAIEDEQEQNEQSEPEEKQERELVGAAVGAVDDDVLEAGF